MERKKALLILVLLFAAGYYLARVVIFYAGATGNMEFEEEQASLVEDTVIYSFLGIGVAGLLLLPGIFLHEVWGFWGTIAVSIYTIIFDLWAFATVQVSAAIGIIPAAVIIGYLMLMRNDYLNAPTLQPQR
ncbi:MAG: hypothetical protein OEM29_08090 [Thermoplasmata archaeon]|nr:hypothetical protein [Thermoplasmata archaeon]